MAQWIADFLAWVGRLISGATACWVDSEPSQRQRIYFGNHTSHLDFVVLWAVLPNELRHTTRPVAAEEYWLKSKLRSYLASRVFRAVLVDRQSQTPEARQQQFERMLDGLKQGDSLIIFPEGTRGSGEEVAPFKSGLYHLARTRPDVELIPVYLENLNRVLPKGEFLPVPLLSRVYFGAPIAPGEEESKDAFLERARQTMIGLAG